MARKMKNSGIEWIGEIPEDWNVLPAYRVFSEVKKKNSDGTEQNALQFKFGAIIRKANFDAENDDYVAGTIATYTVVEPGTVMVNGLNLNYDFKTQRTALVKEKGVITSAYLALWPNQAMILPEFATYLIKGYEAKMALHNMGAGIRLTLGYKEFKKQPILLPPIQEQFQIVAHIEKQCSSIDSIIAQTRSSIEEYNKLKQAVITQAVTKGVRGERTMKDSGIEWIGEVPTDWRITQLRHCATVKSGITLGKTYERNVTLYEMPYLRVANVQDGYVSTEDVATLAVTEDEIEKYRLHAGDVLMTEGGDRDKLGRCVWDGRINPCLHQNHIFAVHTDETFLLPYFLEYLTASKVGRCYFDVTAIKTTNLACTSSSKVLAFSIPLPGTDEQAEIVAYLREKCSAIDTLIAKKQAVLSELEYYKKSMIYEYVTGKKEVPIC